MRQIVPYQKDIVFPNDIIEIKSISLEHDIRKSEEEINGDFIISGEYKTHEISINTERFNYHLPFSVDFTSKVDVDSIEFEIKDFTYETEKDTLKVDIEFAIDYQENIFENPESLDDFIEMRKSTNIEDNELNILPKEEIKITDNEININKEEVQNNIINNITKEDNYVTYHIYIVKENDTIENIADKYHTTIDNLKIYNNIDNLNLGDKIIIPYEDNNE